MSTLITLRWLGSTAMGDVDGSLVSSYSSGCSGRYSVASIKPVVFGSVEGPSEAEAKESISHEVVVMRSSAWSPLLLAAVAPALRAGTSSVASTVSIRPVGFGLVEGPSEGEAEESRLPGIPMVLKSWSFIVVVMASSWRGLAEQRDDDVRVALQSELVLVEVELTISVKGTMEVPELLMIRNAECGLTSDRSGTRDGRGLSRARGGHITGGHGPVDPEHKADPERAKRFRHWRGSRVRLRTIIRRDGNRSRFVQSRDEPL